MIAPFGIFLPYCSMKRTWWQGEKRPPMTGSPFLVSFYLRFQLFHGGVRGILADRFNAVQAGGLGLIALRRGDDLAVAGLQAEPELAGLVSIDLKLGIGDGDNLRRGLILQLGIRSILTDGFNALHAGGFGSIDFAGGDGLAVAGFQIEHKTGLGRFDDKFTHGNASFPCHPAGLFCYFTWFSHRCKEGNRKTEKKCDI